MQAMRTGGEVGMITREKAIEVLENAKFLDDQFYAYTPIHYLESIDMAIEALKAQETPIEKVASDYGLKVDGVRFALEQYQTVICEITRSRMSKLSYYAKDIIQLANEMMCEGCELQEAQEPRVMTLSGVRNLKENTPVWLEDVDKPDVIGALFMRDYSGTKCVDFAIVRDWEHERVTADYIDYGIRWRCWTSRPDDERRENTPWES